MRKILSYVLVALLASSGAVWADLTVLDGAGASKVIKNFVCETTKLCNSTVLIKSDGTEIGTSSAEVFVGGRGTAGSAAGGVLTVQGSASGTAIPVSVASVPSHAVTNAGTFATQSAITAASGSVASGAYSSGSFAAGALAAGALATGSGVDGWDVTQGAKADSACGTATGTCSVTALLKYLNTAVGSAIPAGTNLIGDVNLRQGGTALSATNGTFANVLQGNAVLSATNGTFANVLQGNAALSATNGLFANQLQGNAVLSITNPSFGRNVAGATGGASTTGNIAANNTTAVVVKASAGTLYGAQLSTIGAVPLYLKIYNATSATCGSGTPVKRLIVPKAGTAADGGGSNVSFGSVGVDFSTGITYCITGGIADNDTTAPAASVALVNLDWK